MSSRENHLVTVWQTAKKIRILFFSHSRHIGKIPKFKIQYPELKFEFKSEKIRCRMGPEYLSIEREHRIKFVFRIAPFASDW